MKIEDKIFVQCDIRTYYLLTNTYNSPYLCAHFVFEKILNLQLTGLNRIASVIFKIIQDDISE